MNRLAKAPGDQFHGHVAACQGPSAAPGRSLRRTSSSVIWPRSTALKCWKLKLEASPELRRLVRAKLALRWSPQQISR
jgi:hypothetical protein